MSLLDDLSKPFSVEQVKQRQGRGGLVLDYVSIDDTIRRLNDVLGFTWSTEFFDVTVREDGTVYVALTLVVYHDDGSRTIRTGVGAAKGVDYKDRGIDPDDVIKTAQAEALKKAANLYGVALELWDKDYRADLSRQREQSNEENNDLDLLKLAVYDLACTLTEKQEVTVDEMLVLFDCDKLDLQNREWLLSKLNDYNE